MSTGVTIFPNIFPSGIDPYVPLINFIDDVFADDVNSLQRSVVAIQTYLIPPSGAGNTFVFRSGDSMYGDLNMSGTSAIVTSYINENTPGGSVNIGGHILPTISGTYDLGSPTFAFRTIYADDLVDTSGTSTFVKRAGDDMYGSLAMIDANIVLSGTSQITGLSSVKILSPDYIEMGDSSDNKSYLNIDQINGEFSLSTSGNNSIHGQAATITITSPTIVNFGNVEVSGDIAPWNSETFNLGSLTSNFAQVYAGTGNFHAISGLSPIDVLSELNLHGSIIPTGGVVDIGSPSNHWGTIYVDNIVSSGSAGEYVNVTGDTMTGALNLSVLSGTSSLAIRSNDNVTSNVPGYWDIGGVGGVYLFTNTSPQNSYLDLQPDGFADFVSNGTNGQSSLVIGANGTITLTTRTSGSVVLVPESMTLSSGMSILAAASGVNDVGSTSSRFRNGFFNGLVTSVVSGSSVFADNINVGTLSGTTISGLNIYVNNSINMASGAYIDTDILSLNPDYQEGRVFYDNTDKTLAYYNDSSGVTVNIGQEMLARVRNNTPATILNGQPVYITGALGDRPTIALASASSSGTSIEPAHLLGLATEDISSGLDGYVTTMGLIHNFHKNNAGLTGAVSAGDELYLGIVSGTLTIAEPAYPSYEVHVGHITRVAGDNIEVYVSERPHPNLVLDGPNTVLGVDNSGEAQEYKAISGTNNISIVHSVGLINVSGSLTPTFTTVNASVVSGTTISGDSVYAGGNQLFGTSGTSPISVSNGLVSIASGSASANGYISSGDWVRFDSIANASGNFVLKAGDTMTGALVLDSTNLLATGTVGDIGSLAIPFAQVYAGTGNFHVISGLSPIQVLSELNLYADIIPSGVYDLGSPTSPFETIYVNNIISSGGAGEYVNVTGDTMTGNLNFSGAVGIEKTDTLTISSSGLDIVNGPYTTYLAQFSDAITSLYGYVSGYGQVSRMALTDSQSQIVGYVPGYGVINRLDLTNTQLQFNAYVAGYGVITPLQSTTSDFQIQGHISGYGQITRLDIDDSQFSYAGYDIGYGQTTRLFVENSQFYAAGYVSGTIGYGQVQRIGANSSSFTANGDYEGQSHQLISVQDSSATIFGYDTSISGSHTRLNLQDSGFQLNDYISGSGQFTVLEGTRVLTTVHSTGLKVDGNILANTSGTQDIGSVENPFGTLYVDNIVSSGAAGEYVNVSGDTMTGYLILDSSAGISGNQTLHILAQSGLSIEYDNASNSSSARILITGLTSNANSKLEMTGNMVRLSYDEGVSDGFGSIEFNGDGFTTIRGGQNAGYAQIELNPGGFGFLSPGGGGTTARFSGSNGDIQFITSSNVGAKNASLNINAGQSIVLDFDDSITPFTGSVHISSTGVILSGINIYPYSGNTQKIGDYNPILSINNQFNTMAATTISAATIHGIDNVIIRSQPVLSSAVGKTEYSTELVDSTATNAAGNTTVSSKLDATNSAMVSSVSTLSGEGYISGTTSQIRAYLSNPGGSSSISLSANTITLDASGPGQPAILPTSSGMNIGSAGMYFGTIYVDNVVSTGISAGSFVATSGGSMFGDLTMSGSNILTTGTAGNVGSLEYPFAQVYAGTGNFHAISGLSPLGVLSDLSIGSGNNIVLAVSGASSIGTASDRFSNIYVDTITTSTINSNAVRSIAWNEIPAGTINTSNKVFTLGNAPYDAWSIQLYVNGSYQAPSGIGAPFFDFSLSGSTINMITAPASGSVMIANYQY